MVGFGRPVREPVQRLGARRRLIGPLGRIDVGRRHEIRLARPLDEPVAEATRRHAVVPVVVGEVVEHRLRGGRVAGIREGARLDVLHDRVVAALHVARAHLGAHVERFELLDRVRARPDPQRPADDRVEIDEHALAQQRVDLRLAHAVRGGHRQQMRRLVGRVVVDVHAGVGLAPQHHDVEERLERRALFGVRVRPERRVLLSIVDPAEKIVDPPLRPAARRGRLGVQRIALEIEEDVAAIGPRERADRLREHHLVGRHGRQLDRFGARCLHSVLGGHDLDCRDLVGCRPRCGR